MLATSMRPQTRQIQTLSPRLQHAVRLLQMSSVEFAAQLRDALGQNPFLEADENDGGEGPADLMVPTADDVAPASMALDTATSADGHGMTTESMTQADSIASDDGPADASYDTSYDDGGDSIDRSDDRDMWQADGAAGVRRADDGEGSVMDTVPAVTMLNEHLHAQVNLLALSPRDLTLARAIVESLDDDGWLRTPLAELLAVVPVEPAPTLDELQIALRHVQALEPAGVGARDVAECLRLQLDGIECPHTRALAATIVDEHLAALASRDIAGLARTLGVGVERVEMVCDRIRRLDPRPGWRIGSSAARCIVPDVIVKKQHGVWTVQLNPAVVPKVRLNHMYAELFQRHCKERNPALSQHLQDARWTMRNVEQRFSTIVSVAEAIVRRQRFFLEFGAMAMKPLGLREIADEVGVHESTVSRVTNNKYMTTPNGVYELKYFFSRAMVNHSGSTCSGTAIRGLIKDMIAAEKPDAPLSDAEITRQLSQQGLKVARRTVTKYRQMLKVEAVDRRRRVAG